MSRQTRILVIGGGSIGERHVRCFLRTGRVSVALCDVSEDVRRTVAGRYALSEVFDDLDKGIAASPDAAVICTPAHLHVPIALGLAEAGIHLLIEKPLSTTLDGVSQLTAIVRERSLTAAVAYIYRSHPALIAMREALRDGRFGRPVQLVAVSGQHFPFYRPAYREIYYTDRSTGGGAVQDALTHVVNAAEWLIGPVTRLAADVDHLVLEGVEVEDTAHTIARHGSVLALYSLNQHQAPNESSITVICERAAARVEMHRHRWLSAEIPGEEWREQERFDIERDDLFIRQADGFLDLLDGQSTAACSLAEGLQTLQVNLAILEAAKTKAWQTIEFSANR